MRGQRPRLVTLSPVNFFGHSHTDRAAANLLLGRGASQPSKALGPHFTRRTINRFNFLCNHIIAIIIAIYDCPTLKDSSNKNEPTVKVWITWISSHNSFTVFHMDEFQILQCCRLLTISSESPLVKTYFLAFIRHASYHIFVVLNFVTWQYAA